MLYQKIRRRKAEDPDRVRVMVVDPRRTRTASIADLHLPIRPGSDVALLNGMLHVLLEAGRVDPDFIARYTRDFHQVAAAVQAYPPARAAALCGIEPELLVEAAMAFGQAQAVLSFWSMGMNQSTQGVAKNSALLNLHLATGQIARPGAGPFSLTGQPNAMGGREAGGLAHLLPGYRQVTDPQHRAEVAAHWGIPVERLSPRPGYSALELFEAAAAGKVKALWIMCSNPAASMPNLAQVDEALRRAELVVVQDAYHPTDTSRYAHVLLPAAQWPEKEGVMTNSERRLTYLPAITPPPGEALPDWQIIARLAHKMGFAQSFTYASAAEVFAEFVALTRGRPCDYAGVSHERLQREGPLQWPCPAADHPGSPRLYTGRVFPTGDGRACFQPAVHQEIHEQPDDEYPLVLNTGRLKDQWHTMTRTGKVPQLLKEAPEPFLEIHPTDAARWQLQDGRPVAIISRRGRAVAVARVTDDVRPGTCFMPFHWGRLLSPHGAANDLTSAARDPISRQPELKACAVRVQPMETEAGLEEKAPAGTNCHPAPSLLHCYHLASVPGQDRNSAPLRLAKT